MVMRCRVEGVGCMVQGPGRDVVDVAIVDCAPHVSSAARNTIKPQTSTQNPRRETRNAKNKRVPKAHRDVVDVAVGHRAVRVPRVEHLWGLDLRVEC